MAKFNVGDIVVLDLSHPFFEKGFGTKTGIEIWKENHGVLPDKEYTVISISGGIRINCHTPLSAVREDCWKLAPRYQLPPEDFSALEIEIAKEIIDGR